jgi:hypothetical protein
MQKMQLYNQYNQQIMTGDMIEFSGNGIISRGIRAVTKKNASHSAVVVRMPFEDCVERRFIVEAVASGLEFHLLSTVLQEHDCAAWWFPLKASDRQRERIASWCMVRLSEGIGYDYGGILRQIAARVSLDGRRYFCSEFVHDALINAEMVPEPGDGIALRPGEFGQLGVFGDPVLIYT